MGFRLVLNLQTDDGMQCKIQHFNFPQNQTTCRVNSGQVSWVTGVEGVGLPPNHPSSLLGLSPWTEGRPLAVRLPRIKAGAWTLKVPTDPTDRNLVLYSPKFKSIALWGQSVKGTVSGCTCWTETPGHLRFDRRLTHWPLGDVGVILKV